MIKASPKASGSGNISTFNFLNYKSNLFLDQNILDSTTTSFELNYS